MLVFVFPGQGSQKKGMGDGLFDKVPEYAGVEVEVDRILGYSMRELCLQDSQSRLKETRYTQPSLYVANALHYYQARSEGRRPEAVAGHSLGEYNALLAAGAFDFLTGLRLVQKRGELMAQARNGSMAAVIELAPERIATSLQAAGLNGIDVANYNSPSQTVISGPADELKRAAPVLEAAGARMCIPLPVSAAFHSRYMVEAGRAFESFLAAFTFNPLQIPVVANVTGRPYPSGDTTATVRTLLVKQISQPVRWTESVRHLSAQGARSFTEIGPGNVLTRLVQQIQQAA